MQIHKPWSRREFLAFMGALAVTGCSEGGGSRSNFTAPPANTGSGDSLSVAQRIDAALQQIQFDTPSFDDELRLASGLNYELLVSWQDAINSNGDQFGFNNDYVAITEVEGRMLMWVNHEYVNSMFVSGWRSGPKTRDQVDQELRAVGGSLFEIERAGSGWRLVVDSPFNKRFDGHSPMRLVSEEPIMGSRFARGTFANCAGGVTDWGTFLSAEENYDYGYGEVSFDEDRNRRIRFQEYGNNWQQQYDRPPEHYGWVVEINPLTSETKKLCALGRFAHESATFTRDDEGFPVIYSGDDTWGGGLYKFVADQKDSLESGTLYVANTTLGSWLPLSWKQDDRLRERFQSQTELLIRTREASVVVGGTQMARPEDIAIHPQSGEIFLTLTGDRTFGSILKITEKGEGRFESSTFVSGGTESGFSNPDNITFDQHGGLWMTSDMSGSRMGRGEFESFGNNGLFYIPTRGERSGEVFRMATGPVDSELTGICFGPDHSTLFLAVQHPGERSRSFGNLRSHWPQGEGIPRPAVVQISGSTLESLIGD